MPKTYIHAFVYYNASLQPKNVSRLPYNVFAEWIVILINGYLSINGFYKE